MSDDPILSALTLLNAKMNDGFQRLEAGQSAMAGRLERLETGQAEMRSDMTGLRAEMSAFRSGVMDELGATRAAVMERMDRMQNAITDVHADIAVNFGAVDHARRVNDNTRDEVRGLNDQVARMMTLILRLQIGMAELKGKPDAR